MSPPASLRALACRGEGSGGGWGCSDANNRRGQDKSRNVRPVGCGQISNDYGYLAHIAPAARTLLNCSTPRSCLIPRTLRAAA